MYERIAIEQFTCPETVERVLALEIPDSLCGDGENGDRKGGQHGLPERRERRGTTTINETDI